MKSKFMIVPLFFLALCSFSTIGIDDPIIIRHDQEDAAYVELAKQFKPYMCHLNLPDCEGTIISDEWAITAAHCAIEIKQKLEKGRKHWVIMNDQKVEVLQVLIHPKWQDDQSFDMALVQFKQRPSATKVAKLYTDTNEVGQLTYFVGKGDTGNGQKGITGNDGQLRAATNRVKEVSDRWLAWEFDDPSQPSEALTEYEGISGPGDSGGPAFIVQNEVVYVAGISSFQRNEGIEGVYGVMEYYTRVSSYIEWINKHIGR